MKKFLHIILLLLFTIPFYSQIQSYYNGLDLTATGNDLFLELSGKLSATHSAIPYTGSPVDVWDACKLGDEDPDISTNVLLIYGYNDSDGNFSTDRTRLKTEQAGSNYIPGKWNREHVFAKSLAIPALGTDEPGPGTDVYNLRPSDQDRNSLRSNNKFTDGSGNSKIISSNGGWYPGDEWKGDVARIVMYMYTRYHGNGNQISETKCLPINVGFGTTLSVDANMIDLFLKWNVEDPVSTFETNRNTLLAGIQGNRNPYVDNPYLATLIWGGLVAEDKWNMGGSSDSEAPTAPTNLVVSNITDTSATISWSASTDNIGVFDYLVYVNGIYVKTATTTSVEISNLSSNTTYQITIKARDASNNYSEFSNLLNISTLVGPSILFEEDFSNCSSIKFSAYNEASNRNWVCEAQYGENNSGSYGINGYQEDVLSKDWLITKNSINFDINTNEKLSFYADAAYGSSPLTLVYSSNYDGTSNPANFAWTEVPNITIPIKSNTSSSEEIFTYSKVDISSITGIVYFAFKYYSNGEPTRWTVDSFKITAENDNPDIDGDGVLNENDLCPNTPIGETVDVNGCSNGQLDDDNDGIQNSLDLCAETTAGEDVNADGCSQSQIDDDNDGVMNDVDICPNTPSGEGVDANGCSNGQLDDDNDGIQNSLDLCANTTVGESVNANGCSQSQIDDDNDGVMNDVDTCPNTPSGELVNATGCGASQLDDDNDGVMNNKDKCPNSNVGTLVDANGCFTLASNNFTFETISETCPNKNNGQIKISAQATHSYKATINGIAYNFTNNSLTINGLQPKTYTICISISGETYTQCYEVIINPGTTVSGKSSISSKSIFYNIESGTPPFTVFVNNNEVLSTNELTFSVENIKQGDKLEVKTAVSCEGVLSKIINVFENVYGYPNPTKGNFEIVLPINQKEVFVELYNIQSQLISSESYKVQNNKVQLSIEGKPQGIYFAKVYTNNPQIIKIIKN